MRPIKRVYDVMRLILHFLFELGTVPSEASAGYQLDGQFFALDGVGVAVQGLAAKSLATGDGGGVGNVLRQ